MSTAWDPDQQQDPAARESTLEATLVAHFNRRWSHYSNRLLAEIKQIQQYGIGSMLQSILLTKSEGEKPKAGDPEKAYEVAKSFFERQQELRGIVQNKNEFLNYYNLNPSLRAVMKDIEIVEQNITLAQASRASLGVTINQLFEGKTVKLTDTGVEVSMVDGTPLSLAQLSTGEKQMLTLCVEVLSIDGATTIIIDEPEMSLHVDWQKKLLKTLSILNPTAQIIVATHSPEIMADVDDRCIFNI